MNKEEFELKLNNFLNEETYIMAYRSNYDSARIFNNELIDYIKQLQQENKQLKEILNKYKHIINRLNNEMLDNLPFDIAEDIQDLKGDSNE